ncbi:hypothetical protein [Planctomycetes bacterium CA13]|uniref:hypothetical protein n=1 Tax=Novipirellula herctigrandis TaxID=2527986 RepID=UPI0011B589F0
MYQHERPLPKSEGDREATSVKTMLCGRQLLDAGEESDEMRKRDPTVNAQNQQSPSGRQGRPKYTDK